MYVTSEICYEYKVFFCQITFAFVVPLLHILWLNMWLCLTLIAACNWWSHLMSFYTSKITACRVHNIGRPFIIHIIISTSTAVKIKLIECKINIVNKMYLRNTHLTIFFYNKVPMCGCRGHLDGKQVYVDCTNLKRSYFEHKHFHLMQKKSKRTW